MSKKTAAKESEITIGISLDETNMPIHIEWAANDNPAGTTPQSCKGMLLSLFSEEHKETLKIDLWTKDMQVQEMDRFFYQTLRGMAETYFKATQNRELANQLQQFVYFFGQETGVIPKKEG